MARNETSPAAIERRQRMDEALKLRIDGKLYREISAEMGIAESTAHSYVKDAMAEIPKESAETLFHIEVDRLDMAQKALMPLIRQGDVKAVEALLKIHDRRSKLFHLDQVHSNDNSGEARAMFQAFIDAIKGNSEDQDE